MTALTVPRLMFVSDQHRASLPPDALFAAAVAGGCDAIQVRDKDLATAERQRLLESALAVAGARATVVVNDDLTLASRYAIGLHLSARGISPGEARVRLGPTALIGRSVHSVDEARAAIGADYLIAGSVYATASHPGREPIGLLGLSVIVRATPLPVLAIGGVTAANVDAVIRAGARGVAVIGEIAAAAGPAEARDRAAALRAALTDALSDDPGALAMIDTTDTTASTTITIELNGKPTSLPAGSTVAALLAERGMERKLVVVELNGVILSRDAFETTRFNAGDQVEVVHFVGGG